MAKPAGWLTRITDVYNVAKLMSRLMNIQNVEYIGKTKDGGLKYVQRSEDGLKNGSVARENLPPQIRKCLSDIPYCYTGKKKYAIPYTKTLLSKGFDAAWAKAEPGIEEMMKKRLPEGTEYEMAHDTLIFRIKAFGKKYPVNLYFVASADLPTNELADNIIHSISFRLDGLLPKMISDSYVWTISHAIQPLYSKLAKRVLARVSESNHMDTVSFKFKNDDDCNGIEIVLKGHTPFGLVAGHASAPYPSVGELFPEGLSHFCSPDDISPEVLESKAYEKILTSLSTLESGVREMLFPKSWACPKSIPDEQKAYALEIVHFYWKLKDVLVNFPVWFIGIDNSPIRGSLSFDFQNGSWKLETPFFHVNKGEGMVLSHFGKAVSEEERYYDAANELMKKHHVKSIFLHRGPGILKGDSDLSLRFGPANAALNSSFKFDSDYEKWCANLDSCFGSAESSYNKKADALKATLSGLAEDPLPVAIYELVKHNNYITLNAVVQILRGLNVQLNAKLDYGDFRGVFSLVDADTIKRVYEKMKKLGIFWEREYKGQYGRFYTLKLDDKSALFEQIIAEKPFHSKEKEKIDAIAEKSELSFKDYIDAINIPSCYSSFCLCLPELRQIFYGAPKEIRDFLKMKKSTEKDEWKRTKLYPTLLRVAKMPAI